jgi:site-specific DNA-methyltransferase (adenine-specific)
MAGQSNAPDRWPGRVYEPILFGHKGKRPMLMKGRRNVLNVKAIAAQRKRHPTQKPVLLYRALLQNSVRVGDLVLDPMAGSGASLIAAATSGIRAQGFEMDRGHFLKIKDILKEELYTALEIAEETEVLLDEFQKVEEEITNDRS